MSQSSDEAILLPQQEDVSAQGIALKAFPFVLHAMLDDVDYKGKSHIVSWQPHGRWYVGKAPST